MEVIMKKILTIVTVLLVLSMCTDNAFACYKPKYKSCYTKPAVSYATKKNISDLEWKHQQQAELIEELQIRVNALSLEIGVLKEKVRILEANDINTDVRFNNMDNKFLNMRPMINPPQKCDDCWETKCKVKCKIKVRDDYPELPCQKKPRCPKMIY